MAINYRDIAGLQTVPAYTALTGTVTSNTVDTTVLNYTGSDNWYKILGVPGPPQAITPNPFVQSNNFVSNPGSHIWLYIPSGQHLVQVIGAAQTDATHWTLNIKTGIGSLVNAPCNYVFANLLRYTWKNDGNASGKINNVAIAAGDSGDAPQLAPAGTRVIFQDPIIVDGTGTNFFVTETTE